MKTTRILAVLAVALAAALSAAPASAGGGHGHGGHGHVVFGVGIGLGYPYWGWPGYYGGYYPYYYPPYAYYPGYYPPYASAQSQVYVEQPQTQPSQQAQQPTGYWYYCADSRAYYPYVKECPAGWQRVAPQPQN